MSYYSAIIYIQVVAAIVMIALIFANPILDKRLRRAFESEFALLIVVSVTEWLNYVFNGAPSSYLFLHYFVKAVEFSLIPLMIAVAICSFNDLNKKVKKIIWIAVFVNVLVQAFNALTGWIFYMDESNTYVRGRFYFLFVAFYALGSAFLIKEIVKQGKKFQTNRPYIIMLGSFFAITGIALQLANKDIKTSFLTVEMTLTIIYIYINGLILQMDMVTGLLNRFCYEKRLNEISKDTYILFFDIDNFKSINDTFGHNVGDECLRKAGTAIKKVFLREGKCFRIGGDEFAVIMRPSSRYVREKSDERMNALLYRFTQEIDDIRKDDPRFTGVSVGYAFTDKELGIAWAVEQADHQMYENKQKKKSGQIHN